MAVRTRRLRSRAPSTAISFAVVIVLASTVIAVLSQNAANTHDREVERGRAAAHIARLGAQLSATVAWTTEVAADASTDVTSIAAAALRVTTSGPVEAFVLTRDGVVQRTITASGATSRLGDTAADPVITAAEAAAIADGTTHVVAPVSLDGAPAIAVVGPAYAADDKSTLEARRASHPAVVIGLVRFATLRHPPDQPTLWPGAAVRIITQQGTIGAAVRHPLLTSEVRAGDAVWRVEVGNAPSGTPIVGWLVFLTGLIAAAAVFLAMRRQHQERRRAEDEVDVRSRQLEMIATTSAALQQSLNLAELLPTFAVDVSDEFGLASVSILVADDHGDFTEVFRYGRPLRADETVNVDLRRGWRTVGRLTVHSSQPLDPVSVQSLQAIADLLAIAVTNAQLYQREQQAVARLSELDALKNAFLGTVSHELRTATTAVQGFGELLTEHWDAMPDARRRELASRIRRQAGSLRHLVDDLLDYARLERESLRVSPRELVLGDIVQHLADSFSPLVSSHELVVDVDPEVVAWADPIAVERILANLLSNAGKYAPPATTVTVTVARHGDRARLSVADEGPGIPLEDRRRVFVRFYRLDNSETIRTHGAGIGLSILRDFADRSGAEVAIEDAPGGGALIIVDFPTAPVGATTAEDM